MKRFLRQIYRNIIKVLPTKLVLNIENFRGYHKFVDFNNPKYFGEKIQWLKLFGNLEKYNDYVDKYLVRDFIKKEVGEEYLIPLIGVYDSPEEIDYKKLPKKFVIKLNTGSGYNIIVKDKNELDQKKTNKTLKKWLSEDYAKMKKEPQYKNIQKKILIEEYICDSKDELLDYKFFCFDGKVEFLKIDYDRYNDHKVNFYDEKFNRINMKEGNFKNSEIDVDKPKNYKKMIEICEILSKKFQFVRVDLYNLNGKIYFGELTFTPAAGINPFKPLEKDLKISSMIKTEKKHKILYIGSVGEKSGRLDGVTIKCKCIKDYLFKESNFNITFIDVDNYKKRFVSIILKILLNLNRVDELVICSSSPGASIILRFLYFINYKKSIYYFVCGGILDQWIINGKYNIKWYKNIKKIYVESEEMKNSFHKLGLIQTIKLDNFRYPNFNIKCPNKVNGIIKFVFFGRVIEKKGVEEAIELIKNLRKKGFNVSLDIYGQATDNYKNKILNIIDGYNYIKYNGALIPNGKDEYQVLSGFDIFIFPTKFYEEGLPGALIDAYISGLAVVASNWKYAKEYIDNNKNGIIFEFENYEDMNIKTETLLNNSDIIYKYKTESLKKGKKYDIRYLLKDFLVENSIKED